mmetsp:Transcript_28869/g.81305  ORF Transcript_28869/g.81305 Transcript_28869/m.81305 type:complete len:192 (-) Transcript_28869:203-778(-)|eukprot:CAMPEP_0117683032 /NCGR_PEP_ID=MMETSP0804-20121206/20093_1 /TAXON_ID=1074897 /ORGANISM="Tetraselmis astigmatica, Strain CCMP880" /LENGTH=191 /DNA_ID=CAMNT_0005493417 /DNA_START=205 /DNA_END=780 /DNA_ORIENTATION=+
MSGTSGSSNIGAGAGAGTGASGGAGAGKPPPELWESINSKGKEFGSSVLKRAQSIKVPAELEPTIASARQATVETWAKLPGPVQQAMPFVTVGATVALGMKLFSDRALFAEKVKTMELQSKLAVVTEERDRLKAQTQLPRTDQELKMSKAISDATQAAAAASQAAALAAQACIQRPLQQGMKPSELASRKP